MKKTLGILIATTLLTLSGCSEKTQIVKTEVTDAVVSTPAVVNTPEVVSNAPQFNTVTQSNSDANNNLSNGIEVVCHNCSAKFKLSQTIHEMSLKGDAFVDCPTCRQNYLKAKK